MGLGSDHQRGGVTHPGPSTTLPRGHDGILDREPKNWRPSSGTPIVFVPLDSPPCVTVRRGVVSLGALDSHPFFPSHVVSGYQGGKKFKRFFFGMTQIKGVKNWYCS